MFKIKIVPTIRVILTICLLAGVYSETGIWTTLCLFLVFVWSEGEAYLKKNP